MHTNFPNTDTLSFLALIHEAILLSHLEHALALETNAQLETKRELTILTPKKNFHSHHTSVPPMFQAIP